jgi:hypothetical protein
LSGSSIRRSTSSRRPSCCQMHIMVQSALHTVAEGHSHDCDASCSAHWRQQLLPCIIASWLVGCCSSPVTPAACDNEATCTSQLKGMGSFVADAASCTYLILHCLNGSGLCL